MHRVKTSIVVRCWLLLVVYLSLVAASAVHVHRPVAELCGQCLAHAEHPAHIDSEDLAPHECLLCQLIAASYIGAATLALVLVLWTTTRLAVAPTRRVPLSVHGTALLRAPPAGI